MFKSKEVNTNQSVWLDLSFLGDLFDVEVWIRLVVLVVPEADGCIVLLTAEAVHDHASESFALKSNGISCLNHSPIVVVSFGIVVPEHQFLGVVAVVVVINVSSIHCSVDDQVLVEDRTDLKPLSLHVFDEPLRNIALSVTGSDFSSLLFIVPDFNVELRMMCWSQTEGTL